MHISNCFLCYLNIKRNNYKISIKKYPSAFTIVELLVVIVVLGIIATIVITVLNPAEISAQARDSRRVSDINSIKRAIDIFTIDKTDPTLLGVANIVYISIPDTSSTCANITGLPTLPTTPAWSYHCATNTNLTKTDGTGWLPINFTSLVNTPLKSLPVDPTNSSTSGKYFTYTTNTTNGLYELTTITESQKESTTAINDGGSLPGVYQSGTSIGLTPPTRDKGLVGYWTFDEGTGNIANDYSGLGKNATLYNTPQWVNGKMGYGLQFLSTDSQKLTSGARYNQLTSFSLLTWAKMYSTGNSFRVIMGTQKGNNADSALITSGYKIGYHDYVTSLDQSRLSANDVIVLNTWQLLGLTYDNGKIKLYCDGQNVGEWNFVKVNTDADIMIGGAYNYDYLGNRMWDGLLDDTRIYGRVLTDSEIKSIYYAGK